MYRMGGYNPANGTVIAGVWRLLRYVHHDVFDARMELRNLLADQARATIEADQLTT